MMLIDRPQAWRVWLKIGLLCFGGPAGQIATMHRVLVDERRLIGETRFLHALNFCMLLPGPEAQQLATYVGWLMGGIRGGLLAGGLFILPGALVMLGLSVLYALFADLDLVQGLLFGIKSAVVAVVIEALLRMGRRALTTSASKFFAAGAFLGLFLLSLPFPVVVVAAGILGALASSMLVAASAEGESSSEQQPSRAMPIIDDAIEAGRLPHILPNGFNTAAIAVCGILIWFAPVVLAAAFAGTNSVFVGLGLFFSKMAVVTFGGAYAVLAYVADQAVSVHHWLTPSQMLHGLGLAETTPGPLILVLQFVGFLAGFKAQASGSALWGGILGSLLTLWATFVPSFLWIFLGAPYAEMLREKKSLRGALAGITAAVVGVILNLSVWFALHALFGRIEEVHWGVFRVLSPAVSSLDGWAALLSVGAAVALRVCRWPMMVVLAASAGLGILIRLL